jgi:hypothetical protein
VLVEGISDQIALEALAAKRGRDLERDGVAIVPIGGAHAIGRALTRFAALPDVRLAGLCDAGEEDVYRRALERAGLGGNLSRAQMEQLGFYVCVDDLEDELMRALGTARIEALLEADGDLAPFRTFQKQLAWREADTYRQLRRFTRSSDRRNIRYPQRFVEALPPDEIPRPLHGVLASV